MQKRSGLRDPRTLITAGSAVAFFLVAGVWALFGPSPNQQPATEATAQATATATANVTEPFGPALVTTQELKDLATSAPSPVFWAGEIPDTQLEATVAGTGAVQVRYLPKGSEAGTTDLALTIVSWPSPDAWTMVTEAAKEEGARSGESGNSRYVARAGSTTNAYLANQGVSTLVETFSPTDDVAWTLVSTGGLEMIEN